MTFARCFIVFASIIMATASAQAQAQARSTIFPPQTLTHRECPAGELMILTWTNGGASTNCITGQQVLTLAIPTCNDGEYVARIASNYVCKTVPVCASTEGLSFDGTSFQCRDSEGPPACEANQALTYDGDKFYCINRTDDIPTCNANQFLTYNGQFQCTTITTPTIPTCQTNQYVTADGASLTCTDFVSAREPCPTGTALVGNACVDLAPTSIGQTTYYGGQINDCHTAGFIACGDAGKRPATIEEALYLCNKRTVSLPTNADDRWLLSGTSSIWANNASEPCLVDGGTTVCRGHQMLCAKDR